MTVSILLTETYFQDFNTLANTGTTSNILPVGWQFLETGTNANDTYSINNGSSNAGNTYSYGATGDTDRAFGTLLSGSLNPTIGVSFINNTGATITGLEISYRGEQWRLGATNREDRLDFQYSFNATSLNTGTWMDVNILDFIAPVTTGTVGARDGNAEGNFTNISDTISNLNIGQGETFWLRWLDFNAPGADDGLAVDDFSITPITVSLLPTVTLSVGMSEILESETNTAIEIIANASGAVSGDQTLTLDLSGTANFIDDYTLSSVTITIPDGQTSGSVFFNVVNDSLFEGNEIARLTLANPSAGIQLGSNISADITIIDNDESSNPIEVISKIQGDADVSPLINKIVTIEAIVVGDFQRVGSVFNLRGFYVQEEDEDIDDNPLTSEGLFIFDDNFGVDVSVGDLVRVTGTVGEFTSGTSSLTQLRSITGVTVVSENNPLPTPAVLQFPLNNPLELEAYEGMLVTIESTLTVTEHFQLGRFGQVVLSSDGDTNQPNTDGRLDQFTQFNDPSVEGFAAYQQELAKRRIVLDDGLTVQNPESIIHGRGGNPLTAENTLRGGDMVTGLTGILDDRFGAANLGNYRIQPVASVDFQPTNPRLINVPDVGGSLKVASFNVLNYFNGNGTGDGFNSPEQRGAENALEFERQRAKIISTILDLDADVVGLIEIENDGYGELSAIQDLINGLNEEAGAGIYAFVDPGTGTLGGDAIAVGFVYNTNTVKIAEGSTIATLTTGAFDPVNVARHRVPLAVTFEEIATGEQFTTVTNHFKSKGQSGLNDPNDPNFDQGDGQGFWNATRTLAAQDLATWLATNPTGINDPDILILGDLNAYAKEDPIKALETAGYQNLVADSSYSFVFDGQWGSLDYALATSNLNIQVTGAAKWHINADEPNVLDYNTNFKSPSQIDSLYAADPFRSSDHDPVILGLDLLNVIQGTNGNDRLIGENGRRNYIDGQRGVNTIIGGDQDDIIIGGQGRDILTGGLGNDIFRYNSLIDIGDVITDFTVSEDKIDLSRVLQNIGYSGSNPIADNYVGFRTLGSDTLLQIDADGNGTSSPVNFIRLLNVSAAEMNNVDNFIF